MPGGASAPSLKRQSVKSGPEIGDASGGGGDSEQFTAANPPLMHKRCRKMSSLEQLEEVTAEMDKTSALSNSDFVKSSGSVDAEEESDFFATHLDPIKKEI